MSKLLADKAYPSKKVLNKVADYLNLDASAVTHRYFVNPNERVKQASIDIKISSEDYEKINSWRHMLVDQVLRTGPRSDWGIEDLAGALRMPKAQVTKVIKDLVDIGFVAKLQNGRVTRHELLTRGCTQWDAYCWTRQQQTLLRRIWRPTLTRLFINMENEASVKRATNPIWFTCT